MPQEQTSLFDIKELDTKIVRTTLKEVFESLNEDKSRTVVMLLHFVTR